MSPFLTVVLFAFIQASASAPVPDILVKAMDTTVLLLAGEGAGRLNSISTGVVVRPNGVILTAYHSIKDAKEVQVRFKSGESFDRATLIGVDERRDLAAVKITASNLPVFSMGASQDVKVGEAVYAITNSNGMAWSASAGMLSANRMADEVPGAGHGFRVLQFTAQAGPGASGGPLLNSNGALVGIITRAFGNGPGFAVPIESVIGLAEGGMQVVLGNGSALQMPVENRAPSGAEAAASDNGQIMRAAKTAHIGSRSMFFTTDNLEHELQNNPGFAGLGLALVKDLRVADVVITLPMWSRTNAHRGC
jgi:S1-C subfamily serine protease